MVDFAKNTNYLNQVNKCNWAKIRVGDTKLIFKKGIGKKGKDETFKAVVIAKNKSCLTLRRADNNRVESVIFSDILQEEIKIIKVA